MPFTVGILSDRGPGLEAVQPSWPDREVISISASQYGQLHMIASLREPFFRPRALAVWRRGGGGAPAPALECVLQPDDCGGISP